MGIDTNAVASRLRGRAERLPMRPKVVASCFCAVAALFGAALAMGVVAHPADIAGTLCDVDDAVASPVELAEAADPAFAPAPRATLADATPSAFDGASDAAEVNLFDAAGSQRALDDSEAPRLTAALEAFSCAGCEAGFVLYDFAAQRGLGYNAGVEFSSASTVKAPFVAFVAQSAVDAGEASLDEELVEDLLMEGTGVMAFDGLDRYDLRTVIENTLVHSDNTGYALLRERFAEGFEGWARAAGVDAAAWQGEWYPYYTPRDLAKLWLGIGRYVEGGAGQAPLVESLLRRTGTSFIRQTLGADRPVLAKPGYETDTPFFDMGALNDAGIVGSPSGDYLLVVMSNADYDDECFKDNEPLIVNLIAALDEAHDRLLAA